MFFLSIRAKPLSRSYGITEKAAREAAIKALVAAGSRSAHNLPNQISTETRTVTENEDDMMRSFVEVHIYTSAPDWLSLSIDQRMRRFLEVMNAELPDAKGRGGISVFVTFSQHFSI